MCGTVNKRFDHLVVIIILLSLAVTIFMPFLATLSMNMLILLHLNKSEKSIRINKHFPRLSFKSRLIRPTENEINQRWNEINVVVYKIGESAASRRQRISMRTTRILISISTAFLLLNLPVVVLKVQYFFITVMNLGIFGLTSEIHSSEMIKVQLLPFQQKCNMDRFASYFFLLSFSISCFLYSCNLNAEH
jgi:hypothetical protein